MKDSHHRPYPPRRAGGHPKAPNFYAGGGGFRKTDVTGFRARTDSTIVDVDSPAGHHMVWGRQRRAIKVQQSKSRLELLAEGAGLLGAVKFGHPLSTNNTDRREHWDPEWWNKQEFIQGGSEDVLILKEGKSPADGILHIFEDLNKWSFDCAIFVQLVLLYAVIKRLGKDAFDKRVATHVPTAGRMILRPHFSAGLGYTSGSERSRDELKTMREKATRAAEEFKKGNNARAGAELIKQTEASITQIMKEMEKKFEEAPYGSQVVFTNLDSGADGTAFEHENAIKMGEYQFIAHGIDLIPFVTRGKIEEVLMRKASHGQMYLSPDEYSKRNLYISQIVLYGNDK